LVQVARAGHGFGIARSFQQRTLDECASWSRTTPLGYLGGQIVLALASIPTSHLVTFVAFVHCCGTVCGVASVQCDGPIHQGFELATVLLDTMHSLSIPFANVGT